MLAKNHTWGCQTAMRNVQDVYLPEPVIRPADVIEGVE